MFLWTFNPNGRAKSADLGRERLFFSHTDLYVDKFFFRNFLIQQIKRVELLLLHPFYSVNLWDVELSIACCTKHYKQIYSVKSAKCENINFKFFLGKLILIIWRYIEVSPFFWIFSTFVNIWGWPFANFHPTSFYIPQSFSATCDWLERELFS